MSSVPKFYLPVILPPLKDTGNPLAYYTSIKDLGVEVTADSGGTDGSLEITITNSNLKHPSDQFAQPVVFSTVFAPTSGFASFYPGVTALPILGGQPMAPPPTVNADIGSVVIRVWIADYSAFVRTASSAAPRASALVLGWLQRSRVEMAFKAEIAKMSTKVLEKAWADAGGSVVTTPARSILEAAFLQRFLEGKAEVFVSAGAIIGEAVIVTSSPESAKVRLQAYFEPKAPAHTVFVEADDVIDNAITQSIFEGHPVAQAANADIDIKFESIFTIWDNINFKYIPLVHTDVKLMKGSGVQVDHAETNGSGQILLNARLPRRELIYFEYDTNNKRFGPSGSRLFREDVATTPHPARQYLTNKVNKHAYKAKYNIYPHFKKFTDVLAENEDLEMYIGDRGNGSKDDTRDTRASLQYALTYSSQKGFLLQIEASEKFYREDILPKMFNFLVEGDSWLHYPPDRNDIYGHLDGMLYNALSKPSKQITYVRFPLQHFGDRSDQMFVGDPDDSTRQWHFTNDFLKEYKIDLVICSAGGNDLADPGISNWLIDPGAPLLGRLPDSSPVGARYKTCFTDSFKNGGYFDPFLMESKHLDLSDQVLAKSLLAKSFGNLLANHPWHLYCRGDKDLAEQKDEASMRATFNQLLSSLPGGGDFGESDPAEQEGSKLDEIRAKVLGGFKLTNLDDLPDPHGDPPQRLLAAVFDSSTYKSRFDDVKKNWRVLLNAAKGAGTFVISHTYCYPIFSEEKTRLAGPRRGPWFAPRFHEAKIADRRIRYICLKALIDNYMGYVLASLKDEFPDTFDFADVRDLNPKTARWADEIHLTTEGFGEVAKKIYAIIVQNPRYEVLT